MTAMSVRDLSQSIRLVGCSTRRRSRRPATGRGHTVTGEPDGLSPSQGLVPEGSAAATVNAEPRRVGVGPRTSAFSTSPARCPSRCPGHRARHPHAGRWRLPGPVHGRRRVRPRGSRGHPPGPTSALTSATVHRARARDRGGEEPPTWPDAAPGDDAARADSALDAGRPRAAARLRRRHGLRRRLGKGDDRHPGPALGDGIGIPDDQPRGRRRLGRRSPLCCRHQRRNVHHGRRGSCRGQPRLPRRT